MRERQQIEAALTAFDHITRELDDNLALAALGEEEGDESIVAEAEAALRKLKQEAHTREVEALLSGEADANDAYVEIHAGAGGTESQDWAQMLERMYMRWAEGRGYKVEFIGEHYGEEAGIKSATILVKGPNAYGWLKTESGVHRLVRASLRYGFIRPSTTASRSTSTTRTCGLTRTAHQAPAVSMSIPRTAPSALPTCRRVLSCNVKTSALSTRTGPRRGPCYVHAFTKPSSSGGKKKR